MTDSVDRVTTSTIRPRMNGKRAEAEARIAEMLAAGWTEVTADPRYGPVMAGVRKFVAPGKYEESS